MEDRPSTPPGDQQGIFSGSDDRREFVKRLGKYAVVTSPVVTTLLSTSMSSNAVASSGGESVSLPCSYAE